MGWSLPLSVVVLAVSVHAAAAQTPGQNAPAPPAQSEYADRAGSGSPEGNFIIPLPPSRTLTPKLLAGKKLFVQRCSVCHLPGLPTYEASGPLLDRALLAPKSDEAIRKFILSGSARMPGFQYTLQPQEIDEIVAYLKALDLNRKGRS